MIIFLSILSVLSFSMTWTIMMENHMTKPFFISSTHKFTSRTHLEAWASWSFQELVLQVVIPSRLKRDGALTACSSFGTSCLVAVTTGSLSLGKVTLASCPSESSPPTLASELGWSRGLVTSYLSLRCAAALRARQPPEGSAWLRQWRRPLQPRLRKQLLPKRPHQWRGTRLWCSACLVSYT